MSAKSASDSPPVVIDLIETPPTSIGGILLRLGPGLVIAGSIVGSGELIATTATGAEAGFWLLWLILVGCLIKVFVQVEFGRYSIATGQGTMEGLNQVPGPRVPGRGNWLVWYWAVMFCAMIGQLGGIVGGVGQALTISIPLTPSGRAYNQQMDAETRYAVARAELKLATERQADSPERTKKIADLNEQIAELGPKIVAMRFATLQEQLKSRAPGAAAASDEIQRQALVVVQQRQRDFPNQPEKIFVSRKTYEPSADPTAVEVDKLLKDVGRRTTRDPLLWAAIVAVITSVLLVLGRYRFIQHASTLLVAGFTFVTILNLIMLQQHPAWAISWQNILNGLSFRLPPNPPPPADPNQALRTALATFGIIGVGASELIAYPYWCLERGYARYVGYNDKTDAWANRARGWLKVMRWDAWCSMLIYTFATIAFYLCGAAILGRIHLVPQGHEMIRTLSLMYEPVFGHFAQILFLFGAFAVLYSTFFIANAGQARMCADGFRVLGVTAKDDQTFRRTTLWLSGLFPLVCLAVYAAFPQDPKRLVLISGMMQAIMLPMLSAAALYFRYRRSDPRIMPTKLWDLFLWLSAFGMLASGGSILYLQLAKQFGW
jgi:Mn2+/Fe2+ NRAMP family transporter